MPIEVFISYSHKDRALRDELEIHLSNLKRQDIISSWYDGYIAPGAEWEPQIMEHLKSAQIILLLISVDFIHSDFCYSIEMKQAIDRHNAREARVIPILLRPTDWQGAPFDKLKMLPTDAKPVTSWPTHDDAFADIVQGIRASINDLTNTGKGATPPIRAIPYQRNPLFTGREDVLKRLYKALGAGKTAAISGLGGIGKTQTAVEYAYRYKDDYQVILWVKAESRESIISDFVTIAQRLNLPEKQEQEQPLIIEAVKRWFQEHTGWLLIFDNADDLEMVRDFLPQAGNGHILLTTRAHATGRVARRIEVKEMDQDEGALFLLHRATILDPDASLEAASSSDCSIARQISQVMDGLPLALDQAGAFIEETRCILTDYLHLFQTRQADLLPRRGKLVTDHPDSVATTWSLAFEKVQQANPAAADLLRLCTFLDPEMIQEEIITKGAFELGSILQPVAADQIKLNEAIGTLLTYSLVRRNPDRTLTIHRLVQSVLKHSINKSVQRRWAERAVRAVNAAFPEVKFENWNCCQKCLPHALACAEFIDEYHLIFPEAAHMLNQAADYLREHARYEQAGLELEVIAEAVSRLNLREHAPYEQAEILYQRALAIREKTLGPEHPETASTLDSLAMLYRAQGRFAQAEPLYQRALAIKEKVLNPEDPEIATSLDSLAGFYRAQGRYEQAEPLYQRALAIREKSLGPEHPETAKTINNLAVLNEEQGRHEQAEAFFQQALAIKEKNLVPEHPEIATTLQNLALLYQNRRRPEQAEAFFQQALAIREKTLGSEHPWTATILHNLARLYYEQGRFEQAEPLYQRALAIREKTLGPSHPDTSITLYNLARLYYEQKRFEQAEPLYRRVLAIREKTLGPEHFQTASILYPLAELYYEQGRYEQAEPLYQRVLAIREKTLGPEHPETVTILYTLARLYHEQERYEQAEPLYQRVLIIEEKVRGPEHPETTTILHTLAELYQEQGQYEQAEPLYQRVLAIREKTLGPEHPETVTILYTLARLYHEQERYEQAEPLYQRALKAHEQLQGHDQSDTVMLLENYADLLLKMKREAEAATLEARAKAIRAKFSF